jgi:hypothetical protein
MAVCGSGAMKTSYEGVVLDHPVSASDLARSLELCGVSQAPAYTKKTRRAACMRVRWRERVRLYVCVSNYVEEQRCPSIINNLDLDLDDDIPDRGNNDQPNDLKSIDA